MYYPFDELRWMPSIVVKLESKHQVTVDEVEEVFYEDNRSRIFRGRTGRYRLYGRTLAGRPLLVVLEPVDDMVALVISARDVTSAERRTYFG